MKICYTNITFTLKIMVKWGCVKQGYNLY